MPDAGEPAVETVLGPVRADELGVVLTHEHLHVDLGCYHRYYADGGNGLDGVRVDDLPDPRVLRDNGFASRDNCVLDDAALVGPELARYRGAGGRTLVELTLPDIGRDVRVLREIARRTGVHVVAGCGHYVHIAHPETLRDESVEAVAERLTSELVDGVDGTGVKPGIIGELGTSDPVHPDEVKVLRAAASAQRATGVAVSVHVHPTGRQGALVLDVLEAEGVDPERVVIGHMDNVICQRGDTVDEAVEHHRLLAERGCFIAYDTCGNDSYFGDCEYSPGYRLPTDDQRVEAILRLLDAGVGDRLLLSQDICKKSQLGRFGGPGYAYLLEDFVERLRARGVSKEEIDRMLVDNPRRMLCPT